MDHIVTRRQGEGSSSAGKGDHGGAIVRRRKCIIYIARQACSYAHGRGGGFADGLSSYFAEQMGRIRDGGRGAEGGGEEARKLQGLLSNEEVQAE